MVAPLQRVGIRDADRAGRAVRAEEGEQALERQQDPPALPPVPGDVADMAVAGAVHHLRRDGAGVARLLVQVQVGAVQAHEHTVEVEVLLVVRGDPLEVLERHLGVTGEEPLRRRRGGRRAVREPRQSGRRTNHGRGQYFHPPGHPRPLRSLPIRSEAVSQPPAHAWRRRCSPAAHAESEKPLIG